jgi:hypothetical protein
MTNSPLSGFARSNVSIENGFLGARATAALVFMRTSLEYGQIGNDFSIRHKEGYSSLELGSTL